MFKKKDQKYGNEKVVEYIENLSERIEKHRGIGKLTLDCFISIGADDPQKFLWRSNEKTKRKGGK